MAYRMILEAFWKADQDELSDLVGEDVGASFAQAIADREAAGHKLDNRLVAIERAMIEDARLDGRPAQITVRFAADIAEVPRNQGDDVVARSPRDAVATHTGGTFTH